MVLNPSVQKKAQAEIDAQAYSTDHLPSFEQRTSFPYVTAVVKEVLRWAPPAPLGAYSALAMTRIGGLVMFSSGIPHFLNDDDVYRGYRIPGRSIIMTNLWFVLSTSFTISVY
jgi:cytochrome P450